MAYQMVDLYCGAGGLTSGAMRVARERGIGVQMLAINHWDVAIQTHSSNHPDVQHMCMGVEAVNPVEAVPGGRVDLLVAGVSCTHHSNARGGKPSTEQQRADAWTVLRWCTELDVRHLIIENVREFQSWGPLYSSDYKNEKLRGRPIPEKKGGYFNLFIANLRKLGYRVDYRLLCAAHYGDATTRKRLFIQARKDRKKITWPDPTHVAPGELELYPGARSWRTAREIIDWTIPGTSIYSRKTPLSPNTMARIYAGLRKFSGLPFLVPNFGERTNQEPRTHSVDLPLPTITGHGAGCLVEPFIVGAGGPSGQGSPQCVDEPLETILGENHRALVQPYLVVLRNNQDARTLDAPLPTITTSGAHLALCEPYLIGMEHYSQGAAGDDRRSYPLERPLPTVTGKGQFGLCEPYLIEYHGGPDSENRVRQVNAPMPTLDTSNRFGLCEPFLVQFNGGCVGSAVDEPIGTLTTKDRFGLASPEVKAGLAQAAMLDIKFRMLQPHELAAAHSFPADYRFAGARDDRVKQVGNSVPVGLAAALCGCVMAA